MGAAGRLQMPALLPKEGEGGVESEVAKQGCSGFRQFCILEYRSEHLTAESCSCPTTPVLLAIDGGANGLCLLVTPELAQIVCEQDLDYIGELIRDFSRRAEEFSSGLFQQISSLSVGPLTTFRLGVVGHDDQEMKRYCTGFVAV
jgi:hypothetical protein